MNDDADGVLEDLRRIQDECNKEGSRATAKGERFYAKEIVDCIHDVLGEYGSSYLKKVPIRMATYFLSCHISALKQAGMSKAMQKKLQEDFRMLLDCMSEAFDRAFVEGMQYTAREFASGVHELEEKNLIQPPSDLTVGFDMACKQFRDLAYSRASRRKQA